MKNTKEITDEMLARYLDGKAGREDTELILSRLSTDPELAATLEIIAQTDEEMRQRASQFRFLPLSQLAAANDKNTCSWECETDILMRRGISFDSWSLLQQAKVNNWLHSEGTPLHNVGRVLETSGLSVSRRYGCTIATMAEALCSGADVIAVIDKNKLAKASGADAPAYHAVLVVGVADNLSEVRFRDSGAEAVLPAEAFCEAWAPSRCYMVTAAECRGYDPHPIEVEGVALPAELEDLVEAIAENAHDVWARARIDEGYKYGPRRDDTLKTHPDLVEYFRLPESEKEYDRIMAMNTLRLIQSMGFEITDARGDIECPDCGTYNSPECNYCPHCGKKLR